MEIGLESEIPTYSGGLGVLSGDTICSAADLGVPMVAITLLYRQGHARQILDAQGGQREEPVVWTVSDRLRELPPRATVSIEGRPVQLRAWQYDVRGITGHVVPVLFLDADLPENAEPDRALTGTLYGRDLRYRAKQEALLGIGGIRMLRALGDRQIDCFHLNEGHAAFLTMELLQERLTQAGRSQVRPEDIAAIRQRCVFTTHTPVPAGHDQFPQELVREVLGPHPAFDRPDLWLHDHAFNMTHLAVNLSRHMNGVSKRHGEVLRQMYRNRQATSITNGVHAVRWTSDPLQSVFDRHLSGWREDPTRLRGAEAIPPDELWAAHQENKRALCERAARETGVRLDPEILTLGFARRATGYKRADLLFADHERLRRIVAEAGGLQVVYAGKAHPHDDSGKALIRRIFEAKAALAPTIPIVYLADYNMALSRLITAGADVWLNTPQPPLEASGTSGMKAALNGVP